MGSRRRERTKASPPRRGGLKLRRPTGRDVPAWVAQRRRLWPGPAEEHPLEPKRQFRRRDAFAVLAWRFGAPVGFAEASLRRYANGCESRRYRFSRACG
jgi:aminoglycoside 6'-N-acetyltransferase I